MTLFKKGNKADRLSWFAERRPHFNSLACGQGCTLGYKLAFTMAEILISLTIIGVIAAITLPALVANINEKTWVTQRKALYSRMSQAISLMDSLNGYGIGTDDNETAQNAAETFVTNGLAKVLKITNICKYNNLPKCGLPDYYKKRFGGTKTNFPKNISELNSNFMAINPQKHVNTKAAGFETANGESVAVFYNPFCVDKDLIIPGIWTNWDGAVKNVYPHVCSVFFFDLNGTKGPNKVGKDMWFITSLYPTEPSVVMFDPTRLTKWKPDLNFNDSKQWCALQDARLPNLDEGIAGNMAGIIMGTTFGWLGTDTGESSYAYVVTYDATLLKRSKTVTDVGVRCIKR